MWTSSQFPQTLILCKNLNSGEFLPEEVQLTRLGYGRTVYTLPPSAQHTYPQNCVLKLCMCASTTAKSSSRVSTVAWSLHLKGQISVDFGVQARYVHFSVQKRATLATAWVASNQMLTHDLALYLLSTLLALELRGAVLCNVGPSNMMVRALAPYPQVIFGDVAGWSIHHKIRHRGVGGFENIFRNFPQTLNALTKVLAEARQ